jgi:hypothetical protein
MLDDPINLEPLEVKRLEMVTYTVGEHSKASYYEVTTDRSVALPAGTCQAT